MAVKRCTNCRKAGHYRNTCRWQQTKSRRCSGCGRLRPAAEFSSWGRCLACRRLYQRDYQRKRRAARVA
mgnify:CR=1 FL=1